MKKLNNKGFMLTETLIVATMLITVLMILYVQFKNVNSSFNESFSYNTVGASYGLYNVKIYVEENNYSLIAEKLKSSDYVDLTDCNELFFENVDYCKLLFTKLNINQVIMTNENIYSLIDSNNLSDEMNLFLRRIEYEETAGYRLIASFGDGTYSSIKVLNGPGFDYNISNACNVSNSVEYKVNHIGLERETDTTGVNVYETDYGKESCGLTINVKKLAKETNSCYVYYKSSKDKIDLQLDSSKNVADIYYIRKPVTVTVNRYIYGTTTPVYDEDGVSSKIYSTDLYCGQIKTGNDFQKNITGYKFLTTINANTTITLSASEDNVINVYYEEVN